MKFDIKIIGSLVITLVVGLILGAWLFSGEENPTELHDHNLSEEQTIWTCSMHPQIRQKEPGDCPICGMTLIPLDADNSSIDPMAISMSPTAMKLADIQTLVVNAGNSSKAIRLNGKVQADERLKYTQSSHIPGRIEKLMVNFTGEYVKEGQTIALIYSPELVTAQEELFEAQKIMESQPALFKSSKEKLKNWKLTESQIDKILSSGKPIEQFPVLANVSGYVTEKLVNLGDYIKLGQPIYDVSNLSKVWILFDVYETDMSWINKGDIISYTIQSLPGETFEGTISYLDPVIDPKTRVAKARVEVNNANFKLKPEMFTSGTIETKVSNKVASLAIPKTAVMWTGKRSVVYIKNVTDQGIDFTMREVTLGPTLGESFIIEKGLQSGEEIAVNGTFSIDAAAQLAGKPSMMNPQGGVAMTGHNHGAGTSANTTNAMENKNAISERAKAALQPIYTDYMLLKDALIADKFKEGQQITNKLLSDLNKIDMTLFGAFHNKWMVYNDALKSALQHAEHFKTIEELRAAFYNVSETMLALTKEFHPQNQTIYVQFCPMADNNKGANWLSLSEEILNPYFGEAMLTCGNVEEILKK
jgi:Cu(I)/Ag(I) efflux system membrane fusion protein